ncbi:MAG: LamG-like jellyroll fold domain-containing protein [Planctomycetota bacterium]|jgi:hypothetical protein
MSTYHTKPPLHTPLIKGHRFQKDLFAGWLFNEGGGGIVRDVAGQHHGTLTSMSSITSWQGSDLGRSVYINGSSEHIIAAEGTHILDNYADLTFVIGVEFDNPSASGRGFFSVAESRVSTGPKLLLQYHSYAWRVYSGGYTTFGTVLSDRYYQVVVVIRGGNIYLYVDGEYRATRSVGGTYDDNVYLGSGYQYHAISEFYYCYIYKRAFTAGEIQQIYQHPFCMFGRQKLILNSYVASAIAAPTSVLSGPLAGPLAGPL